MSKTTLPQTSSGQAQYAANTPVTGIGRVAGIIVPSHTNGTVKLVDSPNSASGRAIVDTYTLPSGAQTINFNSPIDFYEGVYLEIGGTANIQLMIEQAS